MAKKLVSILMTSTSMNKTRKKAWTTLSLKHVPCVYYQLYVRKDQAKIQVLINFGCQINAIAPTYVAKLDLKV